MRLTAFHEAGHALVALMTDGSDPIHKATIMPRGGALGMVMQLQEGDGTSYSRRQMLARLDVCMGGRVAEELVFGPEEVTSGASSDIQQATRLARAMVSQFGLSDTVGVMLAGDESSGTTKNEVDREVRRLLTESYARAKHVLEKHRRELDILANGLIEFESLSGEEVVQLLKGKRPNLDQRSQKPSREIKEITKPLKGGSGGSDASSHSGGRGSGGSPPSPGGEKKNGQGKGGAAGGKGGTLGWGRENSSPAAANPPLPTAPKR